MQWRKLVALGTGRLETSGQFCRVTGNNPTSCDEVLHRFDELVQRGVNFRAREAGDFIPSLADPALRERWECVVSADKVGTERE